MLPGLSLGLGLAQLETRPNTRDWDRGRGQTTRDQDLGPGRCKMASRPKPSLETSVPVSRVKPCLSWVEGSGSSPPPNNSLSCLHIVTNVVQTVCISAADRMTDRQRTKNSSLRLVHETNFPSCSTQLQCLRPNTVKYDHFYFGLVSEGNNLSISLITLLQESKPTRTH